MITELKEYAGCREFEGKQRIIPGEIGLFSCGQLRGFYIAHIVQPAPSAPGWQTFSDAAVGTNTVRRSSRHV